MVVLGIGIGSFYPTATTAGVTSVDESQTSLAGGIVYMFQIAGGSIGLGLTTTVFSSAIPPFVDGIQAAFRLDAALSLVGFLIALFFVGGRLLRRRGSADQPRPETCHCSTVFSPGPPLRLSAPGPPRSTSLPGPPKSVSSPGPPKSTSSPPRPISLSLPSPPNSLSGPEPPTEGVAPRAAAHRHRDRHLRADPDRVVAAVGVDFEAGDLGAWQISSFGLPGGCSQTSRPLPAARSSRSRRCGRRA